MLLYWCRTIIISSKFIISKTPSNIQYASRAGDAGVMTAGIYAGKQLAKYMTNTGAVLGGAGGGAIIIMIVSDNVSVNIGSNKFIPSSDDAIEVLKSFFNLSGNDGLDLLYLIQYFNWLDIGLTISIFYFLFCLYTNENTLREILLKIFPAFIVNYYMKIFIIIKK